MLFMHSQAGRILLKEHESVKILDKKNIESVEWLPADAKIIPVLKLRDLN